MIYMKTVSILFITSLQTPFEAPKSWLDMTDLCPELDCIKVKKEKNKTEINPQAFYGR